MRERNIGPLGIVIEEDVHSKVKTYNTNIMISQYERHTFNTVFLETFGTPYILKEIGERGSEIVTKVLKISGVKEVVIEPFQLSVVIDQRGRWISIEPQIFKIFKKVFHTEKKTYSSSENALMHSK